MKLVCPECRWQGLDTEVLTAPNPFEPADRVAGCPTCKAVDTLIEACDEPGCWQETSCGTPTPAGYRRTCGKHRPEAKK